MWKLIDPLKAEMWLSSIKQSLQVSALKIGRFFFFQTIFVKILTVKFSAAGNKSSDEIEKSSKNNFKFPINDLCMISVQSMWIWLKTVQYVTTLLSDAETGHRTETKNTLIYINVKNDQLLKTHRNMVEKTIQNKLQGFFMCI